MLQYHLRYVLLDSCIPLVHFINGELFISIKMLALMGSTNRLAYSINILLLGFWFHSVHCQNNHKSL